MGLSDKLKQFTDKAKESAAEHREQISNAVETAGAVADKRTRGKYSDKIAKATSRTEQAVGRFAGQEGEAGAAEADTPPTSPATPATPASPQADAPPSAAQADAPPVAGDPEPPKAL
jgi:hypothetical protein